MTRGAKQTVKCKRCKEPFEARVADIKRGWGKFCSKSCKAVDQEKRTGAYAAYRDRPAFDHDAIMDSAYPFGSLADHDCNKD